MLKKTRIILKNIKKYKEFVLLVTTLNNKKVFLDMPIKSIPNIFFTFSCQNMSQLL
jgi:hypothetical protein